MNSPLLAAAKSEFDLGEQICRADWRAMRREQVAILGSA